MSDKNNIRKVIVIAVFVLLLIGAVFIYLKVAGGQDGTSSDTSSSSSVTSTVEDTKSSAPESSSTTESSPSSEKLSTQSSTDNSLEESKPEQSKPQSSTSKTVQSFQSKPQSSLTDSKPQSTQSEPQAVTLKFKSKKLLNQHYEKHGIDMGFSSAAEYEKAAAAVPANPAALHKTEKEDGDDVYYIEATNEFVVVSTDGFLRTYFLPDSGKRYFDKQ